MNLFLTKFRLVYIPYSIVSSLFIVSYTALNWLFIIKLKAISLTDEVVIFWLPFTLPVIPIFIWIWPRIKLLSLKSKRFDAPFFYFFVACLATSIPTVITQDYLPKAVGKLTTLQSIDEIGRFPATKYYKIIRHQIDKQNPFVYRRSELSGRHNQYLTFYLYVVCPILDTTASDNDTDVNYKKALIIIDGDVKNWQELGVIDPKNVNHVRFIKASEAKAIYGKRGEFGVIIINTKKSISGPRTIYVKDVPKACLGITYSYQINSNLNNNEKNDAYKSFNKRSIEEFKATNIDDFIYLDQIGNNERLRGYTAAIDNSVDVKDKPPIIFEAKHEPFENRSVSGFGWIFKSYAIGAFLWLIMVAIPGINIYKAKKLSSGAAKSDWQTFVQTLRSIKLTKQTPAGVYIIIINVLIYLAMVFAGLGVISFDSKDLLHWGANNRQAVWSGEWWRLLTSIFLHGGLMHLLNNMFGLFVSVIFLTKLIGNLKFITAYLICGFAASLTSILWNPVSTVVGASGAILGVYGVLAALATTNRVAPSLKRLILLVSFVFVGLTIALGFFMFGVDNAAHIGGFICGVIIGYILYFFTKPPKPIRKQVRSISKSRSIEISEEKKGAEF